MAEVKPTPTQAENDSAALGDTVMNKEHDGSPIEPQPDEQLAEEDARRKGQHHERRDMHAERPGGGYQTRHVAPKQPPQSQGQAHGGPQPPKPPEG